MEITYKSDKIYSLASTHKQELALKNMASLSEIIKETSLFIQIIHCTNETKF